MVDRLDRKAGRLGVTRQSVIKVWIAEMLERKARQAYGQAAAEANAVLDEERLGQR